MVNALFPALQNRGQKAVQLDGSQCPASYPCMNAAVLQPGCGLRACHHLLPHSHIFSMSSHMHFACLMAANSAVDSRIGKWQLKTEGKRPRKSSPFIQDHIKGRQFTHSVTRWFWYLFESIPPSRPLKKGIPRRGKRFCPQLKQDIHMVTSWWLYHYNLCCWLNTHTHIHARMFLRMRERERVSPLNPTPDPSCVSLGYTVAMFQSPAGLSSPGQKPHHHLLLFPDDPSPSHTTGRPMETIWIGSIDTAELPPMGTTDGDGTSQNSSVKG